MMFHVKPEVPRLWTNATCAIFASGPSLTQADVDACHGRVATIAVKDAVRMAPWVDVLYGAGRDTGRWWPTYGPTLTAFAGLRFCLDPTASAWATPLQETGIAGLEVARTGLRTGRHSGYQAINLAVHLGATRILLLGYDMRPVRGRDHWFGAHPYRTAEIPYRELRETFPSICEPLRAAGVTVVNCTPDSALTCFPRCTLADALTPVAA